MLRIKWLNKKVLLKRKLLSLAFGDGLAIWLSGSITYKLYKNIYPFIWDESWPREIRRSISGSFILIILGYVSLLYILTLYQSLRKRRYNLEKGKIVIGIVGYNVILTYWFLELGYESLLVIWGGGILSLLLTLFWRKNADKIISFIVAQESWARRFVPPILMENWPRIERYFRDKPSAPFIIFALFLLAICPFLLIAKYERTAESFANWAYLFLVIGVTIEFYQLYKNSRKAKSDKEIS